MSHDEARWQAHYGGPNQGQQYRCILCGIGGASGRDHKPLTYNCHNKACNGQATMWPTPQYQLYRAAVENTEVQVKAFAAEVKQLCKDFSDLRDRPYMGDVTSALDSLLERFLTPEEPPKP